MATTLEDQEPAKPGPEKVPERRLLPSLKFALRALNVRLRFLLVLLIAFLVVGKWDVIEARWDRLSSALFGLNAGSQAVSADTEYFCPMDPGVLSEWPADCPICNMALVRRKRGDAALLPEGIVARMQLSPYRIQLAGVRTAPVEFSPLTREIVLSGLLKAADPKEDSDDTDLADEPESKRFWFDADLQGSEVQFLTTSRAAEITVDGLPGRQPLSGTVELTDDEPAALTARVEIESPADDLISGMFASAHVRIPVEELEPFRSMPADAPPLRPDEPRVLHVCPNHSHVVQLESGTCPLDKATLEPTSLADYQRVQWWCPMHPEVTANDVGHKCEKCKGMRLVPRAISYRPKGQILTVPESAVINTGRSKLVYVDRGAGMFDGVEVVLGPRCDSVFPVVSGLERGWRVVTNGAFLLDAETRLNPSLAASYFGAGQTPTTDALPSIGSSSSSKESKELKEQREIREALALLSADDRVAAELQKICPVTEMPLGSMGKPDAVVVAGRKVFLCCEGCRGDVESEPQTYIEKLEQLKRQSR